WAGRAEALLSAGIVNQRTTTRTTFTFRFNHTLQGLRQWRVGRARSEFQAAGSGSFHQLAVLPGTNEPEPIEPDPASQSRSSQS
ncbi:MAG: hypothetical protein ABSF53_14200, partial [Terracidiphilus sp.]